MIWFWLAQLLNIFYSSVWIWLMVLLAAIIGKGVILAWRRLSGVNYFDKIKILCNILQHCYFRVWNYSAVFIFWWIWGHFSPWQSLTVIAGLWLVHFIVMVICLTNEDSQCWKIKTVQSSKQIYDSNLHSYLTFSSECLNMSQGVSGRYYLWVVILA